MAFNYSKLRGKIREKCATEKGFAHVMGMSRTTLSSRLSCKTDWTLSEIQKACVVLDIPDSQVSEYFFISRV